MAHLEGSYHKIRRALQHLRLLDEVTRRFTDTQPYRFDTEFDPQTGQNPIRVRRQGTAVPSPDLPLIAGDAIHNLRSALDHLVYQLADKAGTGAGPHTAFPVCNDPKQYWGQKETLLRGVVERHRARIEAVQPYNVVYDVAERKILREYMTNGFMQIINRLDNWDKHRLLLPFVGVAPAFIPVIRGLRDYQIEPALGWVRMEEGAVLCTIVGGEFIGSPTDVKMERDPTYTVVFGNPDADPLRLWSDRWTGAVSYLDLRHIADNLYEFIKSFAGDF